MKSEKIASREEIKQEWKWDLTPLFKTDQHWQDLYIQLEDEMKSYDKYRGKMHESREIFLEALEFDLSVSRDLEKLYTYAHLKSDEDKSNQNYLGFYQKAMNLYTRISELSSYMIPEIQSIPEKTMTSFLDEEVMTQYRFYLEKILRYRPHTRSNEIEQILAMSGEMAQAPSQIFSQLDNADMKFGMIKDEKGKETELSHGNFSTFLMKDSRALRQEAFFQYYKAYDDHKHSISTSLASSNQKDVFYSKVKKFPDSRSKALFSDNIESAVYDNLLSTVKENLPSLFRYLDFRKQALGLDELHFYDTYVPIVKDIDFSMPYEEAVQTCTEALEILGNDYTSTMKNGLLNGWVDRYENRGKRSGAYSSGCYDSPPYILLNYEENNINSLYTLIHEAGHSMHTFYSKKSQPYHLADYTIFVAEVASTFNETLLSRHLLRKYDNDPRMKAYILNREIDNIRGTLFRQTMFAEFEKITHEITEQNQPLTLEVMRDEYRKLLETYFGNTIVIDDELTLECLRIPHFYSAFYVYKYATGISAAIALADRVVKEGDKARDKYLEFLSLGGSKFPVDELRVAGVDMASPEPVKNAIDHFASMVDRFVEVYNKL